jgi:hypothetical protein
MSIEGELKVKNWAENFNETIHLLRRARHPADIQDLSINSGPWGHPTPGKNPGGLEQRQQ